MTDFAAEPESASAPSRTAQAPAAMEFAIEQLRLNPEISFGDLKARGQMDGVKLHPLTYRTAKERLELIPKRQRRPRTRASTIEDRAETAPRVTAWPAGATEAGASRAPARRGRPFSKVMLYVLDVLRESPGLSFREVFDAGTKVGQAVTSAVYSRARARLGLAQRRRH